MNNEFLFRLRSAPVMLVLLVVSVLITLVSSFGDNMRVIYPFMISSYTRGLPEIMQGELWRLITPVFIHLHPLHILLNMLWLFDLGGVIEQRQGSPRFGLLVGVIAVLSNLAQFYWAGPWFGGMSGVVYGLLGYAWMQGRLYPRSGLVLHPQIVLMMLIWFVICWLGIIGKIANMAHTVGLVTGLALGWLFSPNKRF